MDINFQQLMAEAGEGFRPIPPGPYTVECEKAESVTSSTSKPQIRVTLRVLGGDHNGRKLFDQFTLTAGNPTALGFWFDNMAALGLDRSFFASNPAMPYVAQMLLGRQCNVVVKIEPYQGVDRNKIATYAPIPGGQAPSMAPQQGVPQMAPQGAMPMAPQPQPQFAPQPPPQFAPQPQYAQPAPPPPGYAPQPQYSPQPQYAQAAPQVPPPPPVPQVQEPAPWQQQPQQPQVQYQPEQQYAPQAPPQQAPPQYAPQPQYQPVAPGDQQAQPQGAPMWQPSGPPPGYAEQQPQQAPLPQQPAPQPQQQQPPPPMPQGVPPMPGVPGQQRSI